MNATVIEIEAEQPAIVKTKEDSSGFMILGIILAIFSLGSLFAAYFIINRVPSRSLKDSDLPAAEDEEEEDDERLDRANDTETERDGGGKS